MIPTAIKELFRKLKENIAWAKEYGYDIGDPYHKKHKHEKSEE